jgi:hypothetical protein
LAHASEGIRVDSGVQVEAEEILELVRRVVFLSVPHWGTNIADWVRAYTLGRTVVVAELRASVAGSQVPVLDRIERWIAGATADFWGADLLRALQDSLCEAETLNGMGDPTRAAEAREAVAHLDLWLRHMMADFRAIDDLASDPTGAGAESPAHFSDEMRVKEHVLWRGRIATRSYATLGKRLFRFKAKVKAPRWDPINPCTYADPAADASETDIVYRTCYRACAGGPFGHKAADSRIELWDNDGIVNTASMFWPDSRSADLVHCDHMDIVGHYALTPVSADGNGKHWGRKYQAYDLLGSGSEFGEEEFRRIWTGILDFCACV